MPGKAETLNSEFLQEIKVPIFNGPYLRVTFLHVDVKSLRLGGANVISDVEVGQRLLSNGRKITTLGAGGRSGALVSNGTGSLPGKSSLNLGPDTSATKHLILPHDLRPNTPILFKTGSVIKRVQTRQLLDDQVWAGLLPL